MSSAFAFIFLILGSSLLLMYKRTRTPKRINHPYCCRNPTTKTESRIALLLMDWLVIHWGEMRQHRLNEYLSYLSLHSTSLSLICVLKRVLLHYPFTIITKIVHTDGCTIIMIYGTSFSIISIKEEFMKLK